MAPTSSYEEQLQQLIRTGRSVLVAGTGVSIAASRHPQASWTGLLESGIDWIEDHDLMSADEVTAHRTLLLKPKTRRLISTAQDIAEEMGGDGSKHFADWLERTVGSIQAKDRQVLDALDALRQHGHLLATTNYDGLLLGEPPSLDAVTWQETDTMVRVVQAWDISKVLHLHGYWRKPRSVVLDWDSYRRIAEDQDYRQDLRALWTTHTWVYVGCGVDGLSDPDLGLLLERYGHRARRAGHWDYCLVRGEHQRQEFQARFDTEGLNIRAVSFGERFEDLPGFLRSLLPEPVVEEPAKISTADRTESKSGRRERAIPKPPELYAEPPYIGSHQFVGRRAELDQLDDWAGAADPTNILLFEAIGGNGKSMLTWEWTTRHATAARGDWAGRFWYSFYERGAIMQDFCQRALAYMTGRPLEEFKKLRTGQMREDLIAHLRERPWLLVLDGLERVLVAYHRTDASEVPDEEVNEPTDKVLNRDPCDAIRDEDTDLLRSLVACAPSKIVVSSRLTPRVVLNPAGQTLPRVRRVALSGLRPADAEALLRSCAVSGDSTAIRAYLQQNCDNHPLVIGILAGLVNEPGPSRGDFDMWSVDPTRGASLDLADLDLVQRRNHILHSALDAMPETGRQLLATLALLSESVDYDTLEALNPYLSADSAETENVNLTQSDGATRLRLASKALAGAVGDLEARGLLQYERRDRRYDLHPVVRGVVIGGMSPNDKERLGWRVVDHFSSRPHRPYEEASSIEDLSAGLHLIRVYQRLGRFDSAASALIGDFAGAMLVNLEAHSEILALLRPFFSNGWMDLPAHMPSYMASHLANYAGVSLDNFFEFSESLQAYGASLGCEMSDRNWGRVVTQLNNIAVSSMDQNLLERGARSAKLALDLSLASGDPESVFKSRLLDLRFQAVLGKNENFVASREIVENMGIDWPRTSYRKGALEYWVARWRASRGMEVEEYMKKAELIAEQHNSRSVLREIYRLRGSWEFSRSDFEPAATSFGRAVLMARERRIQDARSETGMILSKFNLGRLSEKEAKDEAQRLSDLRQPDHRYLAMLRRELGDLRQARIDALAAYRWAWADGEPYVDRYELDRSAELLQELNVPIPDFPPFDPSKVEPFPWEADVRAAIEEIKAEKDTEELL